MSAIQMIAVRAPIQTEVIGPPPTEEEKQIRTRCGYLVHEAFSAYEHALSENGAAASARAVHFAADLICSGGLDIWIRAAYNYAVQKVNLANPRIFVYLTQRIKQLDKKLAVLPQEAFYTNPEVQAIVSEVVFVLQLCPKHAKVVWPKVDENAKLPGWIRSVAGAQEHRVTRKIWQASTDSTSLYLASNELCKAIEGQMTERALFWVRWMMEEDSRIRKDTKHSGLTSMDRGPATLGNKARSEVGYYISDLLLEIYKELAAKQLIRMTEEFAEIYRLWRCGEIRMAARHRKDCLGLMVMICCEVPRWKVPAAPTLVEDPVRLSRAVAQSGTFFNEVLSYAALPAHKLLKQAMTKAPRKANGKKLTEKEQKELSMEEKFNLFDAAMESYLGR